MKTKGKRHKPVEWAFCVCCNKSVRLDDKESFWYFFVSIYKGHVSASEDQHKIICNDCIPRVDEQINALVPYYRNS